MKNMLSHKKKKMYFSIQRFYIGKLRLFCYQEKNYFKTTALDTNTFFLPSKMRKIQEVTETYLEHV